MFGFFIIRKLFDISCIRPVQLISKPLSVVLAECGHFEVTWSVHVVTWSVQEYSCTVLWYYVVSAGIFLHYCTSVRIFHSECQKELAVASSEPSTSRLPEEDSFRRILI